MMSSTPSSQGFHQSAPSESFSKAQTPKAVSFIGLDETLFRRQTSDRSAPTASGANDAPASGSMPPAQSDTAWGAPSPPLSLPNGGPGFAAAAGLRGWERGPFSSPEPAIVVSDLIAPTQPTAETETPEEHEEEQQQQHHNQNARRAANDTPTLSASATIQDLQKSWEARTATKWNTTETPGVKSEAVETAAEESLRAITATPGGTKGAAGRKEKRTATGTPAGGTRAAKRVVTNESRRAERPRAEASAPTSPPPSLLDPTVPDEADMLKNLRSIADTFSSTERIDPAELAGGFFGPPLGGIPGPTKSKSKKRRSSRNNTFSSTDRIDPAELAGGFFGPPLGGMPGPAKSKSKKRKNSVNRTERRVEKSARWVADSAHQYASPIDCESTTSEDPETFGGDEMASRVVGGGSRLVVPSSELSKEKNVGGHSEGHAHAYTQEGRLYSTWNGPCCSI